MRVDNRLKYWRRRNIDDNTGHVMTQRELGELSGVDYRLICDMERGMRLPTEEELKKICDALGIQPKDIYDDKTLSIAGADN